MFRPDQQPKKPTPPQGSNFNKPPVPSTQSIVDQLRRSFMPKPPVQKPKKESLPNPPVDNNNQFEIEFPE